MKHLKSLISALIGLMMLCSCGEFATLGVDDYVGPDVMRIDRGEFVMMKGDLCQLSPIFEPDTVSLPSIYWQSEDTSVVRIVDGAVYAVEVGTTEVTAISVDAVLRDTCTVHVIDIWNMPYSKYPYDMVIYGDVRLNGEPAGDNLLVAAFVGNEIRGVGVRRNEYDIDYTVIRIYSPTGEDEPITLRAYDRTAVRFYELDKTYRFDGEAHGRLSDLEVLDFTTNY